MAAFIWIWVTAALAVCSIASLLPSVYANPLSAGKNSTSELQGNQSKRDCLYNQYYNIITQVCENCTFCPPGTQHSSQQTCGFGEGVNTTCESCEEKYYQDHRGYSKLKCSRCETCDPNADILQNCSATHNAKCGPCHAGYYTFSRNVCFKCIQHPDHRDCAQTTTETSRNQSAKSSPPTDLPLSPTNLPPLLKTSDHPPSLKTTDHPSSPLPSGDTKGTTDTKNIVIGSQITKGGALAIGLGIGAVILVILICVIVYGVLQWMKRTGTCTSSRSNITQGNANYKPVPTISKDQPSTSSAADAGIVCGSIVAVSGQPSPGLERQQLLGAGVRETPPSFSPSDVTSNCPSVPHTLSINGGDIRDGLGMYPHLDQGQDGYREPMSTEGEPGSPDSAKVNFSFQDDDDQNDSTPEPMELRS